MALADCNVANASIKKGYSFLIFDLSYVELVYHSQTCNSIKNAYKNP